MEGLCDSPEAGDGFKVLKDIVSTPSPPRQTPRSRPGARASRPLGLPSPKNVILKSSPPEQASQSRLADRAECLPGLPGREAERDAKVEKALVQSALNGSIRAQVFWLVNRAPYKWRPVWRIRVAPQLPSLASMLNVSEPRLRRWAYRARSASLRTRRHGAHRGSSISSGLVIYPNPPPCPQPSPWSPCLRVWDNLARRGAGEGNRTLVASLEGWRSAIELHPHRYPIIHRSGPRCQGVFSPRAIRATRLRPSRCGSCGSRGPPRSRPRPSRRRR